MEDIGIRMQRLRKEAGMTTTELASQVGMSQAQVARLENSRQGFRVNTLKRIAAALNVEMSYFFTESEDAVSSAAVLAKNHPWLLEAVDNEQFVSATEKLDYLRKNYPDKFSEIVNSILGS